MPLNRRQILAGMGAPAVLPFAPSTKPKRIVSLNPCLDAILVHTASRDQIAAISRYSRSPQQSSIYDLALGLPVTNGTAEEIMALRPDLVFSTAFEPRATRMVLDRLGVPVVRIGLPDTLAQNLEQVRTVARMVGDEARGDALVARIHAAIAAARPRTSRKLRTLIYQPNGFAAGSGTLMHEMMALAGMENAAGHYGIGKWGNVPLERLIENPPELLLASRSRAGARTWAERMMEHPALSRLSQQTITAPFEENLLYCGGPVLIRTAAALASARDKALEQLS